MMEFIAKNRFYTQSDNIVVMIGVDDVTNDTPVIQEQTQEVKATQELEDLDDIFDSIESESVVNTQHTKVQQNAVDQELLKKIQTRTNIKHQTRLTQKRVDVEELDLEYGKFKSRQKRAEASGGVKDAYRAKIYKLLYSRWNHRSETYKHVQVYIRISETGKMRYEIKQVSGDTQFDATVQAHLEYLLGTIFPISPDGKAKTFKVDFTTKGRE